MLDIVGKEVVEGLPEDDSIEALERVNPEINVADESQMTSSNTISTVPKRRRKIKTMQVSFSFKFL